jgi:hypothetical protein
VVLRAGGHLDDNTFGVAADVNPIDFAFTGRGKPVQRCANRYSHGTRASDSRASRGFGIGSEGEAILWSKEFCDLCQQRQVVSLCLYHRGERREIFLALSIARDQTDFLVAPRMRFDYAAGVARDRRVDGYRAGMEKIERPDVQSSAGQVHARRCFRFNPHIFPVDQDFDMSQG